MDYSKWPRTRAEQIAWMEFRISVWESQADDIGLDPEQATNLASALVDARAKLTAAISARNAAKAATALFYSASDTFREQAGNAIKTIRAFAETSGDPEVYSIANINPPAPPTAAPPPPMPTELKGQVDNQGAIELRWTYTSPGNGGSSFVIFRKLEGQANYSSIGASTTKTYIDTHIPAGTNSVNYVVRALRAGKQSSISEPVTVYLHTTGLDGASLTIAA